MTSECDEAFERYLQCVSEDAGDSPIELADDAFQAGWDAAASRLPAAGRMSSTTASSGGSKKLAAPRFIEAGRIKAGYLAGHVTAWRSVLACTTCGSLVLVAAPNDDTHWTALHTAWHEYVRNYHGDS